MDPAVTLLHHVDGLSAAAPYAYAATVRPGAALVLLAGSCPLDIDGRTVAPGDPVAQAVVCLENMRAALRAAGAGITDVAFVRVLVASSSRAELAAVWDVVREAFGSHAVPGTLQGVTVLGWPDQLVEIEAVAAVLPA